MKTPHEQIIIWQTYPEYIIEEQSTQQKTTYADTAVGEKIWINNTLTNT